MADEESPLLAATKRVVAATCRRPHGPAADQRLLEALRAGADPAKRRAPLPAPADLEAALALVEHHRRDLDTLERGLIEGHLDAGGTWAEVAAVRGWSSPDVARRRYRRLGGTRAWRAGRRPNQTTARPAPTRAE